MGQQKAKPLDQDEALPLLVWLFVFYEEMALKTIFSGEADPLIPKPETQLALADEFLAKTTAFIEGLETWLGHPGSAKVSTFINDMLVFMTTGIHVAKQWRIVVKESSERRQTDKFINESYLCHFLLIVSERYEKGVLKMRREVASQQSKWLREKEQLFKRSEKLHLRRQAITSDLVKRKIIPSILTDEELRRMKNPPQKKWRAHQFHCPMKTSSDLYALTVPRQEFSGWLLSVAAFSQAGLSEVDFIFKDGVLCLQSYWGETSMPYEGCFNGKLTIKPQRLLTLAKKGAKMMPQPIPVKLTVDVGGRLLVVDFVEIHAAIQVSPLQTPKAAPAAGRSNCVGITIAAGHLVEIIRLAYPGRPGKKDVIKFIAAGPELVVQSSRSSARRAAFILGSGEWTVPAQVFRKVLDTFMAKETLTIEVDASGLKLNSFLMPVLTWRATAT